MKDCRRCKGREMHASQSLRRELDEPIWRMAAKTIKHLFPDECDQRDMLAHLVKQSVVRNFPDGASGFLIDSLYVAVDMADYYQEASTLLESVTIFEPGDFMGIPFPQENDDDE